MVSAANEGSQNIAIGAAGGFVNKVVQGEDLSGHSFAGRWNGGHQ
jgi:hypothetical protein